MRMKRKKSEVVAGHRLGRYAGIVFALYLVLTIGFYFLAGDQLLLRQSRGNMDLPVAEAGTVELCVGSVVEQRFVVEDKI